MGRTEDLAIAAANMRGNRDKNLIAAAEALRRLKKQRDLNTNQKLGRELNHSGETVRQFLALLAFEHDLGIMSLFESGRLGLEQGRRLKQLQSQFPSEPDKIREAAQAMISLTAHQSRELVDYLAAHKDITVQAARDQVLASQPQTQDAFAIVALLNPSEYDALGRAAQARRVDKNKLVTEIVTEWLAGGTDGERA